MGIKTLLVYFVFIFSLPVFSQREAYNWYFGNKAGITFHTNPPSALTNGKLSTLEGCASISSWNGRLLFYTDGKSVWDSTHNIMSNGTGLKGDLSTTQAAIIVPKPDSSNIYYIFTVTNQGGSDGIQYSVVDMKQNSGRGDILSGRKNIKLKPNVCEKITAVQHANGHDYWVLTAQFGTDSVFAYLVTSGVISQKPVFSRSGITISAGYGVGSMKVSTDGKKIAYVNSLLNISAVGDFDAATGKISNVWGFSSPNAYGVEFSPNTKFLYITEFSNFRLVRYDLSAGSRAAFIASRQVVDSSTSAGLMHGSLQLGPDRRIYVAQVSTNFLSVIHAPDSSKCRVQRNYISLAPKSCSLGLPGFIQSFFQKRTFKVTRNCIRDSALFTISDTFNLDSVRWNYGDIGSGSNNTSKKIIGAYHIYNKTGNYQVSMISYFRKSKDSIHIDTVRLILYVKNPKPMLGRDTSVCNVISHIIKPHKNYLSYKWSNNAVTASISVKKTGTYILKAKDTVGCMSADTIEVRFPKVTALYELSDTVLCLTHNSFKLRDTSIYKEDERLKAIWYFGDGTNKMDTMAKKTYTVAGTYFIKLVLQSKQNCRDSTIKTITVLPSAAIGFNINKTVQCFMGHSFAFTNTSTISSGTIDGYSWTMGDGSSSTLKNISSKTYLMDTSYRITLVTSSDKNCSDTLVKKVMLNPNPSAGFIIDRDRQCFRDHVFNFTNTSVIGRGSIIKYSWDLGNGQSSGNQNIISQKYLSEDTFMVSLVALSDSGCADTAKLLAVTYAQPVAKFIIPNDTQCWQKHYFKTVNQTTLKYGQMNHYWDFGDGTFDSAYTPFTKSYANQSGKYTVHYKVISDHGCTDSLMHVIYLLERPVSAFDINDSVQCFRGHLFMFVNKTTFSAINTLSYYWDYGNGNTSNGINPITATYPKAQYYPVTLVSYSSLTNCYDTFISMVLPAPHALPDFSVDKDSQCLRFNQFKFMNQSTVTLGSMTYQWDFRDNSTTTTKDPVKHYNANSSYMVKLVVTTNHDCRDSVGKPIVLTPHPKAAFSINDTGQCLAMHGFDLLNTTTIAYGSYDVNWLFDDLTNRQDHDVNGKQFNTGGRHRITLTVNSDHDCTDTTSSWVYLENAGNISIQLANKDSQCLRGNKFDLASTGIDRNVVYMSYYWDFGDGQTSVASPVTYSYTKEGPMEVFLETVSSNGCRDSAFLNVLIHPHPVSSFTADMPCFPEPVIFKNTSSITIGSIVSSYWSFGDATYSMQSMPVKQYDNPGSYHIVLISRSEYGCNDTLIKNNGVMIKEKPTAQFDFTTLPSVEYNINKLQMHNRSSADVVSSYWNFGNGSTSTDRDPIAEYSDSGSKWIQLVVINNVNCKDTFLLATGRMIPDFFFFLPNAYSPDANGINEEFKPVGGPYVHSYIMEIYNRWGEKIFESRDIAKGWDGTYMGKECDEGIYLCRIYVVPLKGKLQSHEITVTLLR